MCVIRVKSSLEALTRRENKRDFPPFSCLSFHHLSISCGSWISQNKHDVLVFVESNRSTDWCGNIYLYVFLSSSSSSAFKWWSSLGFLRAQTWFLHSPFVYKARVLFFEKDGPFFLQSLYNPSNNNSGTIQCLSSISMPDFYWNRPSENKGMSHADPKSFNSRIFDKQDV